MLSGDCVREYPGTWRLSNYTILVDNGLEKINFQDQGSDYQQRVPPVQWALDRVRVL